MPQAITPPRTPALVTLGLAIVIGALTLMPSPTLPTSIGSDKFHHFIAFAALPFPLVVFHPRSAYWLLPSVVLYGAAIELIQPYVNRWGEWGDFRADTLGAMFGVVLGLAAYKLRAGIVRERL